MIISLSSTFGLVVNMVLIYGALLSSLTDSDSTVVGEIQLMEKRRHDSSIGQGIYFLLSPLALLFAN